MAEETAGSVATVEKTIHDHYNDAKAALESKDEPTADAGDDTKPATETVEDPEKPADQPEHTGEPSDDTLLTEIDLAALPPKERANAVKWQALLTQKAQKLSAQEKEFGRWKPLIEQLNADPQSALTALASQLGLTVQKPDEKPAPAEQPLPEELKFLEPIFKDRELRLEAKLRAEIDPIKQAHADMIAETAAKETESAIAAFTADHPDWKKHEARMIEIGQKFAPKDGAMSEREYMGVLYRLATADISAAEQTKKVIQKIEKSAAASDSNLAGAPPERIVHKVPSIAGKSQAEILRLAAEAARRGERWE